MVKRYTILFFILTFFFTGMNVLFAMPLSNGDYPGVADDITGYSFPEVESRSAYEYAGQDDLSIEEQAVWAVDGSIYVRTKKDTKVNLYTITGQLSKQVKVTAGETAIPMPKGLYIVRFDNIVRKVFVR